MTRTVVRAFTIVVIMAKLCRFEKFVVFIVLVEFSAALLGLAEQG